MCIRDRRVFYARPLITDDAVYIGDFENSFHKLDLETGTEKWSFTDAKGYFTGQAAICLLYTSRCV